MFSSAQILPIVPQAPNLAHKPVAPRFSVPAQAADIRQQATRIIAITAKNWLANAH